MATLTPREEARAALRPIDEHHAGLTRAIENLALAIVREEIEKQNRVGKTPWQRALGDTRSDS